MEILQRRTNCVPGNAKGTEESSWDILSHTSSSTQHVISAQGWSRVGIACPFLAITYQFLAFSVQIISILSCPVMTNAHKLLFCTIFFWTCLYGSNKNPNLHMLCFSIRCLLTVSLCSKPTLAPLCFCTHLESNTEDTCPTCHYHQGSKTTGTQQTNSTTNSTTTPQSYTVIMTLPMPFLLSQAAPNSSGFLCPLLSLSLPLSCGKAKHMPQSQVCWRKISVLIYYMNIWLSPTLPRLLKMVYFTVVTLHS